VLDKVEQKLQDPRIPGDNAGQDHRHTGRQIAPVPHLQMKTIHDIAG